MELAASTIEQLTTHDVVFWEKHGILATGADVVDCFDVIDTLSKSAQIYLTARTAGFVPEGMTCEQLDELVPAFHLEKYQM
jgi:rhamnulose-1-phosphate aldolase